MYGYARRSRDETNMVSARVRPFPENDARRFFTYALNIDILPADNDRCMSGNCGGGDEHRLFGRSKDLPSRDRLTVIFYYGTQDAYPSNSEKKRRAPP